METLITMDRKYTLSDFLRSGAENNPDRIAIFFEEKVVTYKKLDEMASRFASGLLKMGIEKGDKVGLYMPNYTEWIVAFFGVLENRQIARVVTSSMSCA